MNIGDKATRRISSSYWMGYETFVVEFDRKFTTDEPYNKGDFEVIIAEYHKDEDKWVLYKEYYNSDEKYIENNNDCFTPYQRAEYLAMAQAEYKRVTCGDSWDKIVGFDDYKKYDAFIDSVKDYYADGDEAKSNEVEDVCVKHLMEMLNELNIKFK